MNTNVKVLQKHINMINKDIKHREIECKSRKEERDKEWLQYLKHEDELDAKFNERLNKINTTELDIPNDVDKKLDGLGNKFNRHFNALNKWLIALNITFVLAIITIITIYALLR